MNKDDVYSLIGYKGEYNTSVKKALRKLLKENHPDNKGDRRKFELINEVKKELESGKVSWVKTSKKTEFKSNSDIDYDYCYKKIAEIKANRSELVTLLNEKKKILNTYEQEYKELYTNMLDMESRLLVSSPYIKKVKTGKILSIIILIIMVILFIISVIKNNNILFIIFIILSIVFIITIEKYLFLMNRITDNGKKRFASYVKANNTLRKNIMTKNEIKSEISDIRKKIITMENDIRFYKNMLK